MSAPGVQNDRPAFPSAGLAASTGPWPPSRCGLWNLAARVCLFTALCFGGIGVSADTLIVHADVAVASLSKNEARLYFTMRVNQWPDGTAVKVFVLPDDHPLHQSVSRSVLGLFPHQLRRAWDRHLFSGTGQVPVTVDTTQELVNRVSSTPGAIGYATADALTSAVRVLEVH